MHACPSLLQLGAAVLPSNRTRSWAALGHSGALRAGADGLAAWHVRQTIDNHGMKRRQQQQQQRWPGTLQTQRVAAAALHGSGGRDFPPHQPSQARDLPHCSRRDPWPGSLQLNFYIMGCRRLVELHGIALFHQHLLIDRGRLDQVGLCGAMILSARII